MFYGDFIVFLRQSSAPACQLSIDNCNYNTNWCILWRMSFANCRWIREMSKLSWRGQVEKSGNQSTPVHGLCLKPIGQFKSLHLLYISLNVTRKMLITVLPQLLYARTTWFLTDIIWYDYYIHARDIITIINKWSYNDGNTIYKTECRKTNLMPS